jgi:hypothetical protein
MLIVIIGQARYIEHDLLCGFWRADADFCQEAGLELFIMHISNSSITGSHNCYIIAKNEDGLIINDDAELCMSGFCIMPIVSEHRKFNATIQWSDKDVDYDYFPKKQTLHYYPKHGKLIFTHKDTVTAILYKDASISDQARIMPDSVIKNNNTADTSDL